MPFLIRFSHLLRHKLSFFRSSSQTYIVFFPELLLILTLLQQSLTYTNVLQAPRKTQFRCEGNLSKFKGLWKTGRGMERHSRDSQTGDPQERCVTIKKDTDPAAPTSWCRNTGGDFLRLCHRHHPGQQC